MGRKKKKPQSSPPQIRWDELPMIERLKIREAGCCFWCKNPIKKRFTKDHVQPVSKGGRGGLGNLVLCCQKCNVAKGNMLINPVTCERISPDVLSVFLKDFTLTVTKEV